MARRCAGSSAGGEDAVGIDDNATTVDPGHATRIGSPLHTQGNPRPGAGEELALYLGLLVATLLELPLAFADGLGYRSATDVHRDLKAITKDGARLRIDAGGCLHGHTLERCNTEGRFGLRSDAFCGRRDQVDAVLDLYRDGVVPGGRGPHMAVISGYTGTW